MKKMPHSEAFTRLAKSFNKLMKEHMGEVSTLEMVLELGNINYHIKLSRESFAHTVLVLAYTKGEKVPGCLKFTTIMDDSEKVDKIHQDKDTIFYKFAMATTDSVLKQLFKTRYVKLEDEVTKEETSMKTEVAQIKKISEQIYKEVKKIEDPFKEDFHLTFMKREYIFHLTKELSNDSYSVLLTAWEGDKGLTPNILFTFTENVNKKISYDVKVDQDISIFIELFPYLTKEVIETLFSQYVIYLSSEGKMIESPKDIITRPKKAILTQQQFIDGLFDLYNSYKEKAEPQYEKRMNRIIRVLKYVTSKS
ncbi:hypothetical protein CN918_31150 [Priestia megaterium]|nr:hypothetical protein CN918_31150 [Priestia megaterium]